jgi:hypothetical protein
MNNLKTYKKFIVVDREYGRPMAFQDHQFCYCTTEHWEDEHWPVIIYSYEEANELINRSKRYRKRKGFEVGEYLLVPVGKQRRR